MQSPACGDNSAVNVHEVAIRYLRINAHEDSVRFLAVCIYFSYECSQFVSRYRSLVNTNAAVLEQQNPNGTIVVAVIKGKCAHMSEWNTQTHGGWHLLGENAQEEDEGDRSEGYSHKRA